MEDIGVLWHILVSFILQSCPSHVLVIIISNRVDILLEGINKGHPSGFFPEFHRLIHVLSLPVTFPPISNMGKGFKDREGDISMLKFF
jgi:hypothetical protein